MKQKNPVASTLCILSMQGGDGSRAKKEKNKKYFSFFLVLNLRLGRDARRYVMR